MWKICGAENGDLQNNEMEEIIDRQNVNVNLMNDEDASQRNALLIAVENGDSNLKIIQLLLSKGCDINARCTS